jgi:hypothetical protein
MSLPEYVAPVLDVAGTPALIFVIMRCFPHTAHAVVVLLAGIAAIVTRDPKRRAACHKVLDTLTRQKAPCPSPADSVIRVRLAQINLKLNELALMKNRTTS